MKFGYKILAFFALLLVSINASGTNRNEICQGIEEISFEEAKNLAGEDKNRTRANIIQRAFENYRTYIRQEGLYYALCFNSEISNFFVHQTNPLPSLSLNSTAGGKPIYIFGLHLNNYQGTLSLSGNYPIYLIDSSLNGCTNCLSINGRAFGVERTAIHCSGKESGGVGIKLIGSRHRVETGSNISDCTTAIQIGDTGRQYGDFMQIRQSAIHGNGTAIKVVKGLGNKFVENSVYENDNTGDNIFDAIEGIFLARRQQGDIKKPQIISTVKNTDTGNTEIEITPSYPNEKFKLEVLLTGEELPDGSPPTHSQGKAFHHAAIFKEVKQNGNYIFGVPTPQPKDPTRPVIPGVVVFQHKDFGSSTFSNAENLNPPEKGILGAFEMESRGEAAGGGDVANAGGQIGEGAIGGGSDAVTVSAGSDGSEMIGGNSVASTPAAIPPPPDEEEESGGDEMSAAPSSPAGDTPAVISGGIDSTAAPGGFGAKGGCGSLNATVPSSPPMLFVFLLTLASLFTWRNENNS